MKLVYVYHAVAEKGGVERALADKLSLLAGEPDCQVTLLTYDQGRHALAFPLDDRVRHVDLNVRLHAQYQYRGLRRLWEGWQRRRTLCHRLRQALHELNPDVLLTTTMGPLSLLLRLKGSMPLVVESHGGYDHLIDYPRQTWRHRRDIRRRYRLLRRVEAIVSLTDSDARRWQADYPQTVVIPDVVRLNPTGRVSDLSQRRVIFVGRLAEQKGIPELMAAWRIVRQRHPDWQLDIYGEGDQKPLCSGVPGVTVLPPVDDVFSKYLDGSMLLLTSRWEPFGLVIPEAMSCGLPVVSFDADGPCDIITDGKDGFLVGNRSVETLADRVCQLIDNLQLRRQMGQAALLSAQRYTPERILPMWKQLFEYELVR